MKGLYKYECYCGRGGDIEGVFIADSEEVKNIIGETVYFGEICGKHSEIEVEIEQKEITLVTQDEKVLDIVEKYHLESGYDPVEYWKDNQANGIYNEAEEEDDD